MVVDSPVLEQQHRDEMAAAVNAGITGSLAMALIQQESAHSVCARKSCNKASIARSRLSRPPGACWVNVSGWQEQVVIVDRSHKKRAAIAAPFFLTC